ncbi:RNA polymerase sigma factor RpoD, partial [Helicobacter pylori]
MKKKANEEKAPKRAKQEAKAEAAQEVAQEVAQENKTKENNKAKESKIKENKTKESKIKEAKAKELVPVKKLSFNEALEELFANSLSDCVSYESIIQISAKVPTLAQIKKIKE